MIGDSGCGDMQMRENSESGFGGGSSSRSADNHWTSAVRVRYVQVIKSLIFRRFELSHAKGEREYSCQNQERRSVAVGDD